MMLRLRDHISAADTEYGIVLLDEDTGEYWNLNPTGALVLRTLLGGGSPADAVRSLTEEYAVDHDSAAKDVADLIGGLRSARLVEA